MPLLRLREILKEKKVSGKDLALKLDVTPNTISFILNEKSKPSLGLLVSIAKELDVDIKDLFNSTKEVKTETIYVEREGKYVAIGKLLK